MATRLIALVLLAGALLPVADLIPGGEHDPFYWGRSVDWLQGFALCAGIGALAAYLAHVRRRTGAGASVTPPPGAVTTPADGPDAAFLGGVAAGALALYSLVALAVFSGHPLLIDEVVQVLQARWYAAGDLWVPPAPHREFFSIMHLVDVGDRVFGQFPAGGPAMLALGTLVGAEWLVGPVSGALCVMLFWRLLGHLEPDATRRWRRGATVLFALTPFAVFMFGSHMNHVTTLLWLLVAMVALARATHDPGASPWWGALMGLALGAAAAIRPMDGAAFALPAAAWLLWRARRGGRPLAALLLSGLGVAIPLAGALYVNAQTTGHALLFGYDLLWGAGHSIGFHASPWGPVHTPQRGVELLSLYLTRLSTHLFELPFPSVLLVAGGLWTSRRLSGLDRYLLASGGLLLAGYWAYWHDGEYLGPRFLVPLIPALVLWAARFPRALVVRLGAGSLPWLAVRVALGAGVVLALVEIAVVRIPSYRNGLTSMRVDIAGESARAGVRDALVLVKESWGARLVVRMWALGVPRSETEILYRKTDACRLELAIRALEDRGARGAEATASLLPLLADSALVIRSVRSPDSSEGFQPGYEYAPVCEAQIESDWRGFSHLTPFRLARDGNIYARWLPGREAEIAADFPGRALYRLVRSGTAVDAGYVWERLSLQPAR